MSRYQTATLISTLLQQALTILVQKSVNKSIASAFYHLFAQN